MSWVCRWVEYYLATSERDAPSWVRRHIAHCTVCQRQARAYQQLSIAVQEYGQTLPLAPKEGWKPLDLAAASRRTKPSRTAIAVPVGFALTVVSVALFFAFKTPESEHAPSMYAQVAPPPVSGLRTEARQPEVAVQVTPQHEVNPSRVITQPVPQQARRLAALGHKAAPSPRQPSKTTPPSTRVAVATQGAVESGKETSHNQEETLPLSRVETETEIPVPVQPVWVEARPPVSTPYAEVLIMQSAHPAAAGGVE